MIETASSAGKGGATICDRSCSRASGRRKKTRRSGIVYKRWERSGPRFRNSTCPAAQTMTSRTGGTRSSGRRMPQEAASGRPLKTRCEHCFLVAPSRTQSRKNLGGIDRRRLRASGEAKKPQSCQSHRQSRPRLPPLAANCLTRRWVSAPMARRCTHPPPHGPSWQTRWRCSWSLPRMFTTCSSGRDIGRELRRRGFLA